MSRIGLLSGGGGDSSTTIFGVGGEAFLVLTPVDHFGVMLGPTAEVSLSGTRDAKYSTFGFSAGLVADP